jgi:SAM-dependent methyltransferase
LFLELARRDAASRRVTVDYVQGDMRTLPWTDRFDRVLSWFTSFGYFDDADNRQVLAQVAHALKPGGRFAVELNHRDWVIRHFQPATVVDRDGDLLIDQRRMEPLTSRTVTERTVIRGGRVRRMPFSVRLFTFIELRDWLLQAGFSSVNGYGEDGEPLAAEHRRMIVVAHR